MRISDDDDDDDDEQEADDWDDHAWSGEHSRKIYKGRVYNTQREAENVYVGLDTCNHLEREAGHTRPKSQNLLHGAEEAMAQSLYCIE